MLSDLQSSLREFMGQPITPEIAARLYAAAVFVPGADDWLDARVLLAGDVRWFEDASQKLGATYSKASGHQIVVALDQSDAAMAYAVFTRIRRGAAAELTAWVRGDHAGFGKSFLRGIGEVAFGTLELEALTAFIAENNVPSLRACKKLGFNEKARIPHYFGAHAGVLMTCERHGFRWAPKEN